MVLHGICADTLTIAGVGQIFGHVSGRLVTGRAVSRRRDVDDICGWWLSLSRVGVAAVLVGGPTAIAMPASVPIAPLIVVWLAVVTWMPTAVVALRSTSIAIIVVIAAALPMPIAIVMALVIVTVATEVGIVLAAPMIANLKAMIGIILECQWRSVMASLSPPWPVAAPFIAVPTSAYPILAAPTVAAKIDRPAIPLAVEEYRAVVDRKSPKMIRAARIVAIAACFR